MTDLLRVPVSEHRDVSTRVLTALGVPEAAAREQAELLLEGDLRGHASHGLRRLDMLAQRLRSGAARADARPTSTWVTESVLVVDGDGGLGPPIARRATEELLGRVAESGVAVAAVRNANHLGMLAPYVEAMAAAGVVGIALTTSEALVHPWGGTQALVGTNPLAVAVPVPGEDPLVLDMATGQVSRGKVLDHAARGLPLAPGDAVDADGVPTTDAAAAVDGAISPFGGPKGYALGVMLEVLVATLTRTALGQDVRGTLDPTDPSTKGDLFIAMDPAVFGSGTAPVADYLATLRQTTPAPGHDRVLVPGDRARATRAANLAAGVPVAQGTWATAQQIAADLSERH
ncbi:Ldh family oxidoreductase [Nocardioides sp. zg-1228]|uniref:Ldh family oxidoreductase n=1 Tax=Nocardioides sp. zg-1228 TaxID=2763008 RepID=UPI001642F19B|nr:Ldh family oxidoreductase [Nocardioides sp. zg-1228]MBC2935137.1 Ldh family oxidoreductase [Nocardioides sp. zg-1228]QSF56991.1 Ldh family oxidoreductase [Nocardioides sp. zg-1228]